MALVFAPRLIEMTDLSPRRARAEAVVELIGFCEACTAAELGDRYLECQTAEVDARCEAWRRWDRERQRYHRLKAKVRPAELPSPQTDPLELGKQALEVLGQLRLQGAHERGLREEAAELVGQLAWGPGPG